MKRCATIAIATVLLFTTLTGCGTMAQTSNAAEKATDTASLIEYAEDYLSIPLADCAQEAKGTLRIGEFSDEQDYLCAEYKIYSGKEDILRLALKALYEKDLSEIQGPEDEKAQQARIEEWARIKLDNNLAYTPGSLEVEAYYSLLTGGEWEEKRHTEVYLAKTITGVMYLYIIG